MRYLGYSPNVIEDEILEMVIPQMVNLRHLRCDLLEISASIHHSFLRCPCRLSSIDIRGTRADLVGCISFLKMNPDIEDFQSFTSPPIEFYNEGVLRNVTKLSFQRPSSAPSLHNFLTNRIITHMHIKELSQLEMLDSNDLRHLRVLSCDRLAQNIVSRPIFRKVEALFILHVSRISRLPFPCFSNFTEKS